MTHARAATCATLRATQGVMCVWCPCMWSATLHADFGEYALKSCGIQLFLVQIPCPDSRSTFPVQIFCPESPKPAFWSLPLQLVPFCAGASNLYIRQENMGHSTASLHHHQVIHCGKRGGGSGRCEGKGWLAALTPESATATGHHLCCGPCAPHKSLCTTLCFLHTERSVGLHFFSPTSNCYLLPRHPLVL